MTTTRVRNIGTGPYTFPPPYRGTLTVGGTGIVGTDKATLLAQLGGATVAHILQLSPGVAGDVATIPTVLTSDNPGVMIDVNALQVKTKYLLAGFNTVHMLANAQGLDVLAPLAGGASQAQANAQANAIQAALIAHYAGVGTPTVDGQHLAADTTTSATLLAVPVASSLATCITLINAILAAVVAHGNRAGVHFHADASSGGTAATITNNPPTTLAQCITDLNDLRVEIVAHMAAASQ